MAATVFAAIFALLAIGGFLGALFGMPKTYSRKEGRYGDVKEVRNYGRFWVMTVATLFLILAPITFVSAGFNSVPTKSVGVLTSYGQVQGTPYGPGSHWLAPWKTLNVVSDTIQSDSFLAANGVAPDVYTNSGATGNCITVRLGGAQEGCADIQLKTQTNEDAIPQLFANYSSYGSDLTQEVDKYVVKSSLVTALNHILGDYNPVMDVSQQLESCDLHQVKTCTANAASQFTSFDPAITAALQSALGNQVTVISVNLQYIHYNDSTNAAIVGLQNSYTETAKAIQQEQTNAAISAANKALVSKTNALTPTQLQQECLSIVQTAIKEGYQLPLTWGNCITPSSSTSVIASTGK